MSSQELAQRDGEVIDAEIVQPGVSMTLFGTDDPVAFIESATRSAEALAAVVKKQGLISKIQNREHVRVEGWTLLGSMVGVFPVLVWTRKLADPEGWEARVEARTRSGEVVGAAEAQCTRAENQWSFEPKGRDGRKLQPRDDYALRSMAQTRATSKALRQPLGFVMTLAGFDATPAEEMPPAARNNRGATEKPKQLSRDEALAELQQRQKNLARLDKQWTKDSVLAQESAELGEVLKEWKNLPDESLGKLLRKARQASSGIEEALGIEEPTTEFVAPEGARGSK